jgi:hypothetical protein
MNDLEALKNTIELNRQELLDKILMSLGIEEIDELHFEEMLGILNDSDLLRDRYLKALDAQEVIELVLKDKLT